MKNDVYWDARATQDAPDIGEYLLSGPPVTFAEPFQEVNPAKRQSLFHVFSTSRPSVMLPV
jgi:hypothetical protein